MNKLILILLVMFAIRSDAQTPGEWTWMHGNKTANPVGVFGTKGASAPNNKPPALYEPCEWKDNNGNFWLFGGMSSVGVYAALWEYDPALNEWTWMNGPSAVNKPAVYGMMGVSSPNNSPGSRGYGIVTWVDPAGDLWLFGGTNYTNVGNDLLNDLWKYTISTNEWTWVNGPNTINDPGNYGTLGVASPSNLPPSRWETSCSWADNAGNLWLYGGGSISNNWFGDLWKYNIAANEWTWMHGSNTFNTTPVYGTQGAASPSNTPGGRYVYCSWNDLSGNLWLFAGEDSSMGKNNDLWKYDITVNQWTWMSGSNTINHPGNYGSKCITASSNVPPARYENRARVLDACGNFWNFGGNDNGGYFLNDLWHLNISTNQWTWVSGDNTPNQATVYGTIGVSAPGNKLGGRKGNTSWIDNNGYIWFFGGEGQSGRYNDLFRYVPDPACVPVQTALVSTSPNTTVCIGQNTTLTAYGNLNYLWSPGGQTTANIVVSSTTSITYTVTGSSPCNSSKATVTVTVIPPPAVMISGTDTICAGEKILLVASGGANYLWNTGQSTASIQVNPNVTTIYTNTVSIANCSATGNFTVTVNPLPLANAWSNATIFSGSNTTLNSSSNSPSTTYNWSPATGLSCITCTGPVAAPLVTTIYCVTVTDSNNCADSACVTIVVEDSCSRTGELYLPSAFSPNDDGDNDLLQLYYGNINCVQTLHVIIYNRWGEKVFESSNPKFLWNGIYKGEKQTSGVFAFYMQATLISGERIIRKGNISLTR